MKLETLVKEYSVNKNNLDELKKIVDEENESIKQQFKESNINELVVDDIKASVVVSKKLIIDNDRLLFILKNNLESNDNELIKTREYVDMDVLENMIYHNEIPANVLKMIGDCKSEKEIKSLRLTKAKE